ncbi:MAG TPA: lysylphosphatidylglycerol synthase domain-containing protein [Polyangiaceae bacterium]|jgi:hypothetical protein
MFLGIALVIYLVMRTEPVQLGHALEQAGSWLPLLVMLEALLLATDTVAFAALVAPARAVTARGWLRSSAASYVCCVLLPAGRAVGEAARAALVARHIGAKRAVVAGTELQAAALLADGIVSAAGAGVVFWAVGGAQHLASALLASGWLVTLAGGALLWAVRRPATGAWINKKFPRMASVLPQGESGPRGSAWSAGGWSVLGRLLQVVQYGIAIFAVGGAFGVKSAFVAHGVHMVGATLGVFVPNQVGVAEAANLMFANVLGFAGAPARALAAMLAIRCAQILLVLACLSVIALLREPTPSARAVT